jgi:hypothetical protein
VFECERKRERDREIEREMGVCVWGGGGRERERERENTRARVILAGGGAVGDCLSFVSNAASCDSTLPAFSSGGLPASGQYIKALSSY